MLPWWKNTLERKVEKVKFRDVSPLNSWAAAVKEQRNHILSIKHAPVTVWEGKCSMATTSKEVDEIAAPQITPAGWGKTALEGSSYCTLSAERQRVMWAAAT